MFLCYLSGANTTNLKHCFFNSFDIMLSPYKGGQFTWGKFFMTSRPSLNDLWHSDNCVHDKVKFSKHFQRSIGNIEFKQTRGSIFS